MLLWGEIDTACHHFWGQSDPESPRHDPALVGFGDTIGDVYEAIDQSMARILDAASPDLICICSDHGFGGASDHVLYLNRYLEQCGWLHFLPQAEARRGSGWEEARRTVAARMPHRLQGGLFRALPGRLLDRVETRGRLGAIDLAHSRAVSDEMNYAATIRLNLPAKAQRQAVDELRDCLLSWEVDGHRAVERVHYREDLYHGSCVLRSPEVVLELALRDGYSYTLLSSGRVPRGQTWERLEGSALRGAKGNGMSGSHRQHGVLFFSGNGVPRASLDEAQMWDIAPSILHSMGESIPTHMDGRALWGEPEAREPLGWRAGPSLALEDEQRDALRGRLQKLGYL